MPSWKDQVKGKLPQLCVSPGTDWKGTWKAHVNKLRGLTQLPQAPMSYSVQIRALPQLPHCTHAWGTDATTQDLTEVKAASISTADLTNQQEAISPHAHIPVFKRFPCRCKPDILNASVRNLEGLFKKSKTTASKICLILSAALRGSLSLSFPSLTFYFSVLCVVRESRVVIIFFLKRLFSEFILLNHK